MATAKGDAEIATSTPPARTKRHRRLVPRAPTKALALAWSSLLTGCSSDLPPVVTTPEEAISIAVEQCGNEFHLGKPSGAQSSDGQWIVSWPTGTGGQESGAFSATIDPDLGVLTTCQRVSG